MITQDIEELKAALGDREFTGNDVIDVLHLPERQGVGSRVKYMFNRNMIVRTKHGYRFVIAPEAPVKSEAPAPVAPIAPSEKECNSPPMVRIGELYLHERMLLIADTARQEASDAVRIYTTVIEVDPATKHPRNKVVNFIKTRDPREYAQALVWLNSLAGAPIEAVDDTALELAAETELKLSAANKEIAALKAKIEAIRSMIRGELSTTQG